MASSIWSALLALAAVPIYLDRLGIEGYGLVGFFLTLQAVMQMLDLGLAPAVNREVARNHALGRLDASRSLLRTLARLYWLSALLIGVTIFVAAPAIARTWLGESRLPARDLVQSLQCMGLLIAARWPMAVYQNTLVGAGRLASASAISAGMATVSVAASIATITWVSPHPQALFAAQLAAALVQLALVGSVAWKAVGGAHGAQVDWRIVGRIWHFSSRMGAVVLTGIAMTQLDKALLSKLLPLRAFGEYMLAVTIVGGLSVLVAPLFNLIYPHFSAQVARGQSDRLAERYCGDTALFSVAFLPIAFALGLYAHDLVWLWTGREATASAIAPIVALLCVGSAINGLMFFPYSLQLAHGLVWIPLAINLALLAMSAPLIWLLASSQGGLGGAAAWAALEAVYLVVGTRLTHRHIPMGSGPKWIWQGIGLPFAITTAAMLLLRPAVAITPEGSPWRALAIGGSAVLAILACLACLPELRTRLKGRTRSHAPSATPA